MAAISAQAPDIKVRVTLGLIVGGAAGIGAVAVVDVTGVVDAAVANRAAATAVAAGVRRTHAHSFGGR